MTSGLRNRLSETWIVYAPLTIIGGFLDAYTYISRGRVLGNAITGNLVFLGVDIVNQNYLHAFEYGLVVVAYGFGALCTLLIEKVWPKKLTFFEWRQVVLLCEVALLTVIAFIHGQEYNMLINICTAFLCAMQVQGFRNIHGVVAASTMCTGNLRSGAEKLYHAINRREIKAFQHSMVYFTIIALFVGGVVLGAFMTSFMGDYASLICAGVLFLVAMVLLAEIPNKTIKNNK